MQSWEGPLWLTILYAQPRLMEKHHLPTGVAPHVLSALDNLGGPGQGSLAFLDKSFIQTLADDAESMAQQTYEAKKLRLRGVGLMGPMTWTALCNTESALTDLDSLVTQPQAAPNSGLQCRIPDDI